MPVEAVFKRDDMVAVRAVMFDSPLARELDGAFVRLRAGIAEHRLPHAGARAELFRKQRLRRGIIPVGSVLQLQQLGHHRRLPGRVGKAEAVHRNARAEVDIRLALAVINGAALAAHQDRRMPAIGVFNIGFIQLADLHARFLLICPFKKYLRCCLSVTAPFFPASMRSAPARRRVTYRRRTCAS